MCDPDGYPGNSSERQNKPAEVVDVAVKHVERAISLRNLEKPRRIEQRIICRGTAQNPRPSGKDLTVVYRRLVCMHQEIDLEFIPIKV